MAFKYSHVAVGGTFDLLHKGHISLLEKASNVSRAVSIGITTDKFCHRSGKYPFESQTVRRQNLLLYLKNKNWAKRVKIIWLNDIYGTTNKDKTIEAVVVAHETLPGAKEINKARSKNKLKNLRIIVCPEVLAQDKKRISSGRIRAGEISPDGINYYESLLKIAGIRFDNRIRTGLKKPFGKIVKIDQQFKYTKSLIAVGDVTVQNLLKNKIIPDLSIVDFLVNRQRVFQNLAQLGFSQPNPDYVVENTPGQLSKDLIISVQKSIQSKIRGQIILVEGEEDLAFIPALLLSPFPSTLLYGQPEKGAVMVTSSIETKNRLCHLLKLT